MDLYRAPVNTSMPPSALKSSGTKLRRKLQKIGSQQRSYFASSNTIPEHAEHHVHFVEPKSYNTSRRSCDTNRRSYDSSRAAPAPQHQQFLPLPSNLSDSKWSDFVRKSSYQYPVARRVSIQCSDLQPQTRKPVPVAKAQHHPQPKQQQEAPPVKLPLGFEQARAKLVGLRRHSEATIPEFAHLSISSPKPRQVSKQSFSSDTTYVRSPRVPSPNPEELSVARHRRRAKTPVHSIGQLEVKGHQRVSSGDRIADSYKALLETRSFVWSDRGGEAGGDGPKTPDRQYSSPCNSTSQTESLSPQSSIGSPYSTDSTLVDSSDEDTMYFKPDSPQPVAPLRTSLERRQSLARSTHPSTTGNPSLQIAVDLLTRELSSAARGIPLKPSSDTSALQVWVMIEAYEKLRDQVLERRMPREQERSMLAMFDTWLESLQKIHDEMTGNDGTVSESVYDDALE
ncbi:hypothetical protein PG996_012854 [Apiospora saccharicola]|uniref:Mating-type switching protein swi10 n=1 Tax=Apiospora saccharicola TaxID=335842 RepID=A0ABR1U6J9_9PEZI